MGVKRNGRARMPKRKDCGDWHLLPSQVEGKGGLLGTDGVSGWREKGLGVSVSVSE